MRTGDEESRYLARRRLSRRAKLAYALSVASLVAVVPLIAVAEHVLNGPLMLLPLGLVPVAAVLLIAGAHALDRATGLASVAPRCGTCGYDVAATWERTGRCPECGSTALASRATRASIVDGLVVLSAVVAAILLSLSMAVGAALLGAR